MRDNVGLERRSSSRLSTELCEHMSMCSPSKSALFVPVCENPSLAEQLGGIPSNDHYILAEFITFKPHYHPRPVLRPEKGGKVLGRLFYVDSDMLSKLDAYNDEGRTLYRIDAIAHHCQTLQILMPVQIYVWNGNSYVGEWENRIADHQHPPFN
jgi:hypothetical protein